MTDVLGKRRLFRVIESTRIGLFQSKCQSRFLSNGIYWNTARMLPAFWGVKETV
jgi:hypothetical protein